MPANKFDLSSGEVVKSKRENRSFAHMSFYTAVNEKRKVADDYPEFPTRIASGEHILVAAILERSVRRGKRYGFVAVLKPDSSEYHIAEVAHDISTLETFAYRCYTRDDAGSLEYISNSLRAGDYTPINDVQLSSLFSWDQ